MSGDTSKIKELCGQLKMSEEGTGQLLTLLEAYRKDVEKEYEDKFNTRLEEAMKVCLEEVKKEKADLSRKVEIFLEARVNAVTREAQKQAAIGEAANSKTLREIKALLEGVKLENVPEEYQAAVTELKKLRLKLHENQEEKAALQQKVQQVSTIAMKSLKYNKNLETRLQEQGESEKQAVLESKQAPTLDLEQLRTKTEEPRSTRKILVESQTAKKGEQDSDVQSSDAVVMNIAQQLDGDPAFVK
jgi:hypothetical protein